MASVGQGFFKWLRGGQASTAKDPSLLGAVMPQLRHSTGLGEMMKHITGREDLKILDLGATSPQNIMRLTGMGHRIAS